MSGRCLLGVSKVSGRIWKLSGRQGCRKLRPSRPPVSDKVKVGQTNHMGQERYNWTYCQYEGHLIHKKDTIKLFRTILANREFVGQTVGD